jgi:hypothetical protein
MPGTTLGLTRSPFDGVSLRVAFGAVALVAVLSMALWVHNRADAAPTYQEELIGAAGGL